MHNFHIFQSARVHFCMNLIEAVIIIRLQGKYINLFQQVHVVRPSLLFISWRWERKATRHCTESQNTTQKCLPQNKVLESLFQKGK